MFNFNLTRSTQNKIEKKGGKIKKRRKRGQSFVSGLVDTAEEAEANTKIVTDEEVGLYYHRFYPAVLAQAQDDIRSTHPQRGPGDTAGIGLCPLNTSCAQHQHIIFCDPCKCSLFHNLGGEQRRPLPLGRGRKLRFVRHRHAEGAPLPEG